MGQTFIDHLLEPMRKDYEEKLEEKRPQASRSMLRELLGSCVFNGKRVSEIEDEDEFNEAVEKTVTEILKYAGDVCKAIKIGGKSDLKEKAVRMSTNQLMSLTDIFYSLVSEEWDFRDGYHSTVARFPKHGFKGEHFLALIHQFMAELMEHTFDIENPEDLHTLAYNCFILMAVVEAKTVARAHVKNIDIAGLLENPRINALVSKSSKVPMCNALKNEDFFDMTVRGNEHFKDLRRAMKKEQKTLDDLEMKAGSIYEFGEEEWDD